MPELPDLVYIERILNTEITGKTIRSFETFEPIIFRVLISIDLNTAFRDVQIKSVHRHGPFIVIKTSCGNDLVIHPMLAGKFKLGKASVKSTKTCCLKIVFSDDRALLFYDDKRMAKIYIVDKKTYQSIPRFDKQGVNILSEKFTLPEFRNLIKGVRKQVRVFLMDQTKLSAIGNAYADEILFDAGLHPKTFCYQLDDTQVEQLYHSIRRVMDWGITQVRKAARPIDIKVRDHVKVRNRKDQPCPVCGKKIRRAGVLGYDAFFCPKCQPSQRPQFIDWSETDK
jgi:formamidopyrimidine-DNA glycosylase